MDDSHLKAGDGAAAPRRVSRRKLLTGAGAGALVAATGAAGATLGADGADVRTPGLRVLRAREETELNAWCEVLVPGAGAVSLPGSNERGVARFVDHQLAARPGDVLLTIRSDSDVGPPYVAFYRSGLSALRNYSRAQHGAAFSALDAGSQIDVVRSLATATQPPAGWAGPAPFLWYFLTRSDAVDVVFGTPEGFADLGHPYLAHMAPPPTAWVTDREQV